MSTEGNRCVVPPQKQHFETITLFESRVADNISDLEGNTQRQIVEKRKESVACSVADAFIEGVK
jgi:hypothetical protein